VLLNGKNTRWNLFLYRSARIYLFSVTLKITFYIVQHEILIPAARHHDAGYQREPSICR
jgi:hypothetical protein